MRLRPLLGVLALVVIGAFGCSGQQEEPVRVPPEPSPRQEQSTFETSVANAANEFHATFKPLNDSGVDGEARIAVDGRRMTLRLETRGLRPGEVYALSIHGFSDGRLSQAPPETRGLSERRLADWTGPVLLPLASSVRAGPQGRLPFARTMIGAPAFPLDIRALVVSARGPGRSAPVAFALLRPAELGDGGVGGPGSSDVGAGSGGAADGGMTGSTQGGGAGASGAATGSGGGPGGQ